MRLPPAAAVGLAAVVLAAGCSLGGDDEGAEATTTTTEAPEPADGGLTAGQEAHEIGVAFQSGAFLVTLGEAVIDLPEDRLHLGVRLQNLSDTWTAAPTDALLRVGDVDLRFETSDIPRVPPGFSTDRTATVRLQGHDPLDGGQVVWGRADERQTVVDLATGESDGFGPALDVALDGWGRIGKFTVQLVGARLFPDAVQPPRVAKGEHVLRIEVDEYTSHRSPVAGFFPDELFLLVRPDGVEVEPLRASRGRGPMSWTASGGSWVDFAVPDDPEGDYVVRVSSVPRGGFTLHHDLIEHVELPFSLEVPAEHGPVRVSTEAGDPPRPRLPRPEGSPEPPAVDEALATGEVNVPGFAVSATSLQWDPGSKTAVVDGLVRRLPPILSPLEAGDPLSIASRFGITAALVTDGRIYNGVVDAATLEVTEDPPIEVAFEFANVPHLVGEDATLVLGIDSTLSTLPLGSSSPYQLDPAVPELHPVEAPLITAGDYQVQLVGYRFGLPRELDRPPLGERSLELVYDVTAVPVEPPGVFGYGFASRTQLFLQRPDGFLEQSVSLDTADLQPGQTARLGAAFYVPAGWQPGRLAVTARSHDELLNVTRHHWLEVTVPADLLPPSTPPEADGPGSEEAEAAA